MWWSSMHMSIHHFQLLPSPVNITNLFTYYCISCPSRALLGKQWIRYLRQAITLRLKLSHLWYLTESDVKCSWWIELILMINKPHDMGSLIHCDRSYTEYGYYIYLSYLRIFDFSCLMRCKLSIIPLLQRWVGHARCLPPRKPRI